MDNWGESPLPEPGPLWGKRIFSGIMTLILGPACLYGSGSIIYFMFTHGPLETGFLVAALLVLIVSLALLEAGVRFLINKPRKDGGAINPFVLLPVSILFIILAIVIFFTSPGMEKLEALWPSLWVGLIGFGGIVTSLFQFHNRRSKFPPLRTKDDQYL